MKIENENGYICYSVDDMDENGLVIDCVEAYAKRRGTGSLLVDKVIEIARNENKKLGLCAYPQDDSVTLAELIKFYENLGFSVDYNDGEEALMSYQF